MLSLNFCGITGTSGDVPIFLYLEILLCSKGKRMLAQSLASTGRSAAMIHKIISIMPVILSK